MKKSTMLVVDSRVFVEVKLEFQSTLKVLLLIKTSLNAPGSVYTKPEEFKNAALFVWLGLPSTLIPHENGASLKRFSNRRNLKKTFFFGVNGKHLKTELFETMRLR